ncbi:unnamed protein product, partial [marine sediment metagenome]
GGWYDVDDWIRKAALVHGYDLGGGPNGETRIFDVTCRTGDRCPRCGHVETAEP